MRHNPCAKILKNCFSELAAAHPLSKFVAEMPLRTRCVTTPAEISCKTVSQNPLRHNSCRNLLKHCLSRSAASHSCQFFEKLPLRVHSVMTPAEISQKAVSHSSLLHHSCHSFLKSYFSPSSLVAIMILVASTISKSRASHNDHPKNDFARGIHAPSPLRLQFDCVKNIFEKVTNLGSNLTATWTAQTVKKTRLQIFPV